MPKNNDNESVCDVSDTDSDIYYISGKGSPQPEIKIDSTVGDSSLSQPDVDLQQSDLIDDYNSFSSSASNSSGNKPDSPHDTRLRARMGDMQLRSGRWLPRR